MELPVNDAKEKQPNQKPKLKRKYRRFLIIIASMLTVTIFASMSGIVWARFVGEQRTEEILPLEEQSAPEAESEVDSEVGIEPEPEPIDPCNPDVIPQLLSTFTQAQAEIGVEFAISYYNINGNCTFEQNADQAWLAASTAKIAIALMTFENIASGIWTPDTWISYNAESHFEGGAGPLQFDEAFTGATVSELAELMITQSDNIATNMLLSQLGWTIGTQEYIARITGIPAQDPSQNLISAHQHLLIMQHLLNANTPGHSEILLWMEQASDRSRLAAITNPDGTQPVVAHKIGDYWDESGVYYHDVAYVQGENPYLLIVMTKSASGVRDDIYAQITDLGQQIQALHTTP